MPWLLKLSYLQTNKNNMYRIHSIILVLLLPFSLLSQEWKAFNDTSCSFTAKYPSNWVNKIKEGKRVFFTSPVESDNDVFLENVNISMNRDPTYGREINIKDVIPSVLEKASETVDSFSKLTERYFKWNGYDGCELIYTGQPENSELTIKSTQWFCFSEGRLFIATYVSAKSNVIHTETAMEILRSIRFR